jgi:hypothetical protein
LKITGHQPNYLPYPGFFQKILFAEAFVLVDTTQFVKRGPFGWIHRNRIRYHQTIAETRINNAEPWARKHLRTLEYNYRKAPHFNRYFAYFKEVYNRQWELLTELNEEIIRFFASELDITIPFYKTSELSTTGKATELIINFCRQLGADAYISGVHGKDYLDLAAFEKNNIRLVLQDFYPVEYPQQFHCKFMQGAKRAVPGSQHKQGEFIPNLSIIDMLMNCGPEKTRALLLGAGEQ